MDKLKDIIDKIYNVFEYKKRISFESKDNNNYILFELEKTSSYIDNIVSMILVIENTTSSGLPNYILKLSPMKMNGIDSHNYIISKHIMTIILKHSINQIQDPDPDPDPDPEISKLYSEMMTNDQITLSLENIDYLMNIIINHLDYNYDKYYTICPICFKTHDVNKMIINPCEKCIPDSYDIVFSNIVTDTYNNHKQSFKLILYTSLQALKNTIRFIPLPPYSCKQVNKQINNNNIIDKLKNQPDKKVMNDFDTLIKQIEQCKNDLELFRNIKKEEYMFLKHILISNNTRINHFNTHSHADDQDQWTNDKIIVYTVDHSIYKQNKFDTNPNVVHMFHGSHISNWYSIMRNGLKNYSGTEFMTNGQAYGKGIYFATDLMTSLSYSNLKSIDGPKIVGVVQVINSEKYKKTNLIYVVPDENDVLLKYLVVINNKNEHFEITSEITKIQTYLTLEFPNTIKNNLIDMMMITQKRLNKESDELSKRIKKISKIQKNIVFTYHNHNHNHNHCHNNEINDTNKLLNWKLKINDINISVEFTKLFPSYPPIIQVDKFINIPMLINSKNFDNNNEYPYVYMDPMMMYDKWRSDVKIYKIIIQLIQSIVLQI